MQGLLLALACEDQETRVEGSAYFENAQKRSNRHPHSPLGNPLPDGTFSPFFS